MTQEEIEKEVQERVEFKMNEFKTALRNKVAFKYQQAFDMTQKSQYVWQSLLEIEEMIDKEMYMPLPYDNITQYNKWLAKEEAVKKMDEYLKPLRGRGPINLSKIVSIIEQAQNY